MTEQTNPTKNVTFYSQKAIGIATFIGGPMAAGYLIRENYFALNKPDNGNKAFLISIIATFILFGGIFIIPDNIIEKIPNQILPLAYTGIIYLIVEKIHGTILKDHEKKENKFFSAWKAAGIGFISLMILATIALSYIFLSPVSIEQKLYNANLEVFTENENESLKFYDNLNIKSNIDLVTELNELVIPKWQENVKIIESANQMESLSNELIEQNEILLNYSKLRLEAFELYKKALLTDTDIYNNDLEEIHIKIDEQLSKLN